MTVTRMPCSTRTSSGSRNARPSPEATTTWASVPSARRASMWASMSSSTSESSVDLGFAKTANPTLRSASTHGRTISVEPGTTLVNTVASATPSGPASPSSQRPTASKRGRNAEVGRAPSSDPRLMSMFGASQTSSVRPGPSGTTTGPGSTSGAPPASPPGALAACARSAGDGKGEGDTGPTLTARRRRVRRTITRRPPRP